MSNSFLATPARAFKQSLCRAKVTRQPGFFDFQILNSVRTSDNAADFSPGGWPGGIYVGAAGPFVAWADFIVPDPRGATFLVPTATQLKADGWLQETWNSALALPAMNIPPEPFFVRIGSTDHARLHKSTSPLGIFNSETIASPRKVRTAAIVIKHGMFYDDVTSSLSVFFPTGVSHDQIQKIKLYDKVPGTITKHTISNFISPTFQAPPFSGSLPTPTAIQAYTPAIGDPPVTFEPNEPVYTRHHVTASGAGNFYTAGTLEILAFWFYLTPADLPSFPFTFNTNFDFFFVG